MECKKLHPKNQTLVTALMATSVEFNNTCTWVYKQSKIKEAFSFANSLCIILKCNTIFWNLHETVTLTKNYNYTVDTKIKTVFWQYLWQSTFLYKCRETKKCCIQLDDSLGIHYPSKTAEPELQNTTSMATGIHVLVFHQRSLLPDI